MLVQYSGRKVGGAGWPLVPAPWYPPSRAGLAAGLCAAGPSHCARLMCALERIIQDEGAGRPLECDADYGALNLPHCFGCFMSSREKPSVGENSALTCRLVPRKRCRALRPRAPGWMLKSGLWPPSAPPVLLGSLGGVRAVGAHWLPSEASGSRAGRDHLGGVPGVGQSPGTRLSGFWPPRGCPTVPLVSQRMAEVGLSRELGQVGRPRRLLLCPESTVLVACLVPRESDTGVTSACPSPGAWPQHCPARAGGCGMDGHS